MSASPVLFRPPTPENEPVLSYAPGSPEREELRVRLEQMKSERIDAPLVIGGEEVRPRETFDSVMPHDKSHVLARVHKGDARHVELAGEAVCIGPPAAAEAWEDWHKTAWEERAAVFLRAAELLSGPWRATLNAATMLGQSKTVHQAEIDAACELTDFFRFNVQFMLRIYEEQPISSQGMWNRMEYRPLEGFVFAVTPFNFTSICGNLPSAPAIMGNPDRPELGARWQVVRDTARYLGGEYLSIRKDPAAAEVQASNVLTDAPAKVIVDKWSVDQAIDWEDKKVKEIYDTLRG